MLLACRFGESKCCTLLQNGWSSHTSNLGGGGINSMHAKVNPTNMSFKNNGLTTAADRGLKQDTCNTGFLNVCPDEQSCHGNIVYRDRACGNKCLGGNLVDWQCSCLCQKDRWHFLGRGGANLGKLCLNIIPPSDSLVERIDLSGNELVVSDLEWDRVGHILADRKRLANLKELNLESNDLENLPRDFVRMSAQLTAGTVISQVTLKLAGNDRFNKIHWDFDGAFYESPGATPGSGDMWMVSFPFAADLRHVTTLRSIDLRYVQLTDVANFFSSIMNNLPNLHSLKVRWGESASASALCACACVHICVRLYVSGCVLLG